MTNTPGTLWVRKTDLERLFGARRICYLITGYDGSENVGDIGQLAASIERINTLASGILPVPLIPRHNFEHHEQLCRERASVQREACFIYYTAPRPLNDEPNELPADDLADLGDPPASHCQVLVSVDSSFQDGFGGHTFEATEALGDWLRLGGERSELPPQFLIIRRPAATDIVRYPESRSLRRLLERATTVVVEEGAALEAIASRFDEAMRSKLFLSEDALGSAVEREPTAVLLCKFLQSGYIASLEGRYQRTLDGLLTARQRLSDVQPAYARLLSQKSDLETGRRRILELEAKLEEATLWAERAVEDVLERDDIIRHYQAELASAQARLQSVDAPVIGELQTSRAWRLVTRYWRTRDRIKRALRRLPGVRSVGS